MVRSQKFPIPFVGEIANVKDLNNILAAVTPDQGDFSLGDIAQKTLCWPWAVGQNYEIDSLKMFVTDAGSQSIYVCLYEFNGGVVGDQIFQSDELDISGL